jgi:hypothetical protein
MRTIEQERGRRVEFQCGCVGTVIAIVIAFFLSSTTGGTNRFGNGSDGGDVTRTSTDMVRIEGEVRQCRLLQVQRLPS